MADSANDRDDLALIEGLVVDLLEGVISKQDKERLNELLLASPRGRQLYLQYAQLESALQWIYSARKQAATVIDETIPGEVRPIADIAQQQLRFADDARFIQVMTACAANESHSQDWLQLFPRILAITSLRVAPPAAAARAVQAIVNKLLADYEPDMSPAAFWSATADATWEVLQQAAPTGSDADVLTHDLLDSAFAAPELTPLLDAASVHEILDECIPHLLPADTLRVLCLRYLHGLSPRRIAMHLNRPMQHVQLHLSKVRIHLVARCVSRGGEQTAALDAGDLHRWSRLLDAPANEASRHLWHANQQENESIEPTHLLLLAMVHDYLGRELSPKRLLDEIPAQKNEAYLLAIEQSLRDIEALGATPDASLSSLPRKKADSRRPLAIAAILGIAAGLLLAIGVGVWMNAQQPAESKLLAVKEPEPKPKAPPQPEVNVAPTPPLPPPQPPVVAVLSEALGVAARDGKQLAVGAVVRQDDVIAFERGIVQITTISGSTLVLEGPVDATVTASNRLALRRGKVVGLNKSAGESLTIDAPNSSIVDLGTEFGVAVSATNETDVAVYEGEVRLDLPEAGAADTASAGVQLQAGWEATIETSSTTPLLPTQLAHDRQFVRADEVQLRKEAQSGDRDAAAKVAFYELLRIKGLLAYQGFHRESVGNEFSIGFRSPAVRQTGDPLFKTNINDSNKRFGASNSLAVEKDVSCYLDLDNGPQSRTFLSGIVDERGMIGHRSGEVWLCWRTKAYGPQNADFSWAGMSLMYGDNRSVDEPLFIGQPAPIVHYGIHMHAGMGTPAEMLQTLDKDSSIPGEQPQLPDFEEHLWVVRLRIDEGKTEAAVWCDPQLAEVATSTPDAVQIIEQFQFDRLRLEAQPKEQSGGWLYDDVVLATSSEAIAEALSLLMSVAN
ncbi:FecR domain-containing protein [Lacipirellula sp.]|uniref:FecR domain-containing protein n=1 Tax=Lacipirellula sp. TaxID=2691419 RepID=UPI003D0B4DC7